MDHSFSFSKDDFSYSKLMSLRELKDQNLRLQRHIQQSLACIQEEYIEVLKKIEVLNNKEHSKRKLDIEFLRFTNPRENQSTLLYFLKNFTGDRNDLMPYEIENNEDDQDLEENLDAQIMELLKATSQGNKDQKKEESISGQKIGNNASDPVILKDDKTGFLIEKEMQNLSGVPQESHGKNYPLFLESAMLTNLKEENFEDFGKESGKNIQNLKNLKQDLYIEKVINF